MTSGHLREPHIPEQDCLWRYKLEVPFSTALELNRRFKILATSISKHYSTIILPMGICIINSVESENWWHWISYVKKERQCWICNSRLVWGMTKNRMLTRHVQSEKQTLGPAKTKVTFSHLSRHFVCHNFSINSYKIVKLNICTTVHTFYMSLFGANWPMVRKTLSYYIIIRDILGKIYTMIVILNSKFMAPNNAQKYRKKHGWMHQSNHIL